MKRLIIIIISSLIMSGCSKIQLIPPTPTATLIPTSTSTITPTSTTVPTPTITPTPDIFAKYLSLVPEIPSGFEWKILPEKNLAVVMPNGWFFKDETRGELALDGVYVTKENIDEVGRFSTGLSVFIFKDFNNNDEAEQFAKDMFVNHMNLETTKEILDLWDYTSDPFIIHHLRIRTEYPYETEENKNKIIHYSVTTLNNSVYWAVFESPESLWEETLDNYGIVLNYIVIFEQ